MMNPDDDFFGEDFESQRQAFEDDRDALMDPLSSFAIRVEKPSEGGLKIDLDRFRRTFDDRARAAKRAAGTTLANVNAVLPEEGSAESTDEA
jgi:hypothetical protein